MKIGMVSDSLANLDFATMLDTAAALGLAGIEVNTGNFSAAPHLDLAELLASAAARARFLEAFRRSGLALIALNASGNQLHPVSGERHAQVLHDTLRLAGLLGVETVVLMSGLPGGGPKDSVPNWVVSTWPPETGEILAWQWESVLLPFWHDLAKRATAAGVRHLCVEMHGNQLVYNVPALLRLRQEIGPLVGANLDPSHLFWMGADPLAAVDALGAAILHVHAKDAWLNPAVWPTTSLLESAHPVDPRARAWSYVTLGYGHSAAWWTQFCYRLRLAGYDGWLSIEHEDAQLARQEGLRRAVTLLTAMVPADAPDYVLPPG